jgi:Zn-dependent protease with chaperone function
MQLIPIVLVVAVVLAAEGGLPGEVVAAGGPVESIVLTCGPIVLIVAAAQFAVWLACRRARMTRQARALIPAERLARVGRWLIVVQHVAALLLFGWFQAVQAIVGDLVFVDELIALLPALLGLVALWWVYYPVERLLRQGVAMERLDEGLVASQPPGRLQYVFQQLQVHMMIMLIPILLILAVAELIEYLFTLGGSNSQPWLIEVMTLIAAFGVFLIAPFLTRLVLSVRSLETGTVRDDLLSICTQHRVGVRDILVWRTGDSMINAAVMGLLRPLRYVLLTDALLHLVPPPQLRAVMAHEIAHVRRRHLPWLLVTLVSSLVVAVVITSGMFAVLEATEVLPPGGSVWIDVLATAGELIIALLVFGWACRRFERQADTFAVQHLSGLGVVEDPSARSIRPEAVLTMCSALEIIARLNAVDPGRRSWRHGSIAWRQSYLQTLVGLPLRRLPIDRVVRGIKLIALLILIGAVTATVLLEGLVS